MSDLKKQLLNALAKSSSSHPVDTDTLAIGHQRTDVEAALLLLYMSNKVCCCKIIKGGHERVVWWISGIVEYTGYFGKINTPAPARVAVKVKKEFKPRKRSELTINVLEHIKANPGWLASEIIDRFPAYDPDRIRQSLGSLRKVEQIEVKGMRRQQRYYLTPKGEINGHQ